MISASLYPCEEQTLNTEDAEDTEENTSPPALSSKLEREPKSCTIMHQRVSITLSTRLWGERAGERGVSSASSVVRVDLDVYWIQR